jgi:hypothetical protein
MDLKTSTDISSRKYKTRSHLIPLANDHIRDLNVNSAIAQPDHDERLSIRYFGTFHSFNISFIDY